MEQPSVPAGALAEGTPECLVEGHAADHLADQPDLTWAYWVRWVRWAR